MPKKSDGRYPSRRAFLGLAGVAGAAAGAAALGVAGTFDGASRVVERAFGADPAGVGSLADIDHFVLLMQENRSFDHYIGAMSGVRGFDDPSPAYRQSGWTGADARGSGGYLLPFHLDTRAPAPTDADVVNDPAHDWSIQHEVWNGGAMNRWLQAHAATDGAAAPMVMGYYTRADLPVHYALADAFTVCDNYFSSVLGPTAPNRLFWMSGTNDSDGANGGPVIGDLAPGRRPGLRWRTFAENLEDAGVSWKIYNSVQSPNSKLSGMVEHFAQYQDPASALHRRGIAPSYPHDFLSDVRSGTLPSVSWIIPSMAASEHPAHPAAVGADEIVRVLDALTSQPALWERTALIVSYDENGGLFDHVAPPTPPPGTPGEFVSTGGRARPVGLGFRVPALVLSPYTRGGLISSAPFDHTSQLRLIGRRFGVPVPNLTTWRRLVTHDMTVAFGGPARTSTWVPSFPEAAATARAAVLDDASLIRAASGGHRPAYPVPASSMPRQETLPRRRRLPV
jgi:phospholipase C